MDIVIHKLAMFAGLNFGIEFQGGPQTRFCVIGIPVSFYDKDIFGNNIFHAWQFAGHRSQ